MQLYVVSLSPQTETRHPLLAHILFVAYGIMLSFLSEFTFVVAYGTTLVHFESKFIVFMKIYFKKF